MSALPTHFAFALVMACAPLAAASLPGGFTETVVTSALSEPTAMALAPDGRIFIAEKGGDLRVVKNDALLASPFLSLAVNADGERGLLGVAFDPDFSSNHFVYVYYTSNTPTLHNRVTRFTAQGDVAVAGSETPIFDLDNLSGATNHNGGAIHFGPDGKLYIAAGENANPPNSQSFATVLGKILRINANGTAPVDNPFLGSTAGKNRAIWVRGLRNPFTFSFQPGSGRLFINDVGQDTWEEINDGIAGSNYGWPNTEGPTSNPAYRSPLFAYNHDNGCAITGGAFYNPATTQFPAAYVGKYFFADYCGGWIHRFDPATRAVVEFATGIDGPVDLLVEPAGSLLYLAINSGDLVRISASAGAGPQITQQPADLTVAAGQPASFHVAATGAAPLAYQWRRGGAAVPGATAPTYTLPATSLGDDGAVFDVVVGNTAGSATSDGATLRVLDDQPPVGTITSPGNGTLYRGGERFTFSGTASDPEDGDLPAAAFTWQIVFHHESHTHPFLAPTTGIKSGTFTIPRSGETSADVFYRVHLKVRDALGLTHESTVDVVPRKVNVTLATVPPGLRVKLDGQPLGTPATIQGVEGIQRSLGVVEPQTVGGTPYVFQGWSDGGAKTHTIATPPSAATYTATYAAATGPSGRGLLGSYFDGLNLSGPARLRLDKQVSFDWGTGQPLPGMDGDTFSVRWSGKLLAKVTGTYTFTTLSDDGVRLWVNNKKIIDDWTDHSPFENSGAIALVVGQFYDIRLEFYEDFGTAVIQLFWSAPGLPKRVIPQANLYPYALLLTGEAPPTAADAAVRDRLTLDGFAPVVARGATSTASDAKGKALLLLSSTVDPATLGTRFRASPAPLISWEPALFDDLGMTGNVAGTGFGTIPGSKTLRITAAGHPLAAGLSGTVTVASAPAAFSFGEPNAKAIVVARQVDGPQHPVLFAYERNAAMPGLAAPARRVGLFFGDTTAGTLTSSGWRLFDAAVSWAVAK